MLLNASLQNKFCGQFISVIRIKLTGALICGLRDSEVINKQQRRLRLYKARSILLLLFHNLLQVVKKAEYVIFEVGVNLFISGLFSLAWSQSLYLVTSVMRDEVLGARVEALVSLSHQVCRLYISRQTYTELLKCGNALCFHLSLIISVIQQATLARLDVIHLISILLYINEKIFIY